MWFLRACLMLSACGRVTSTSEPSQKRMLYEAGRGPSLRWFGY